MKATKQVPFKIELARTLAFCVVNGGGFGAAALAGPRVGSNAAIGLYLVVVLTSIHPVHRALRSVGLDPWPDEAR